MIARASIEEMARSIVDRFHPERLILFGSCARDGFGPDSDVDFLGAGYPAFEYVREEWGDLLAAADLVVSRAGANTLFELLELRKPNLLVPLSRKASRGDQIENAEYARQLGYSRVLQEDLFDFHG